MEKIELDLKVINEVLEGVFKLYNSSSRQHGKVHLVDNKRTHTGIPDGWGEGSQGEYNEETLYYRHTDLPENIFIRVVKQTDSYGENDYVNSISFVQGKEKQVTVYEPI